MFCPSCGHQIQQQWQHCTICGAILIGLEPKPIDPPITNQFQQSMVISNQTNSFSINKILISIFIVAILIGVSVFMYLEFFHLGLISEGHQEINEGNHQIIYLDSVEEIEWNVTYFDSEWPKSFTQVFPGVDPPEASLVHSNGNLYFFLGSQYHRYSRFTNSIDKSGQIGVDGWTNVPQNLDAALLHSNDKAYFFKGDNYYRYVNGDVDKIGKIGIDGWEGVPTHIDAAVSDGSTGVYFFKKDLVYHYQSGSVTTNNLGNAPFLGLKDEPNAAWQDPAEQMFFTHTGDKTWKTENGIAGWAPAYDILFFDEDGCSAWVRGESPEPITELSRQGVQKSVSASGNVDKGDYCLVIDNSNRFSNPYNGRSISVGWNVNGK
jgi:hypothetical protein